ncbi:kinase-like domain-containing protein [Rhizophagus clarus]|nr:kinase-like domain-containing protein [Rhizophagus clarus]
MISLIQHDNFQVNVIQVWEQVLKWGIAQNPKLPSDPFSYSKEEFNILKNILQQLIPFIKFFNLSHKEFLDKVYPYKKILPKDLRENLIKHFINQPNNNLEPNRTDEMEIDSIAVQRNLSIEKDYNYNMVVNGTNNIIYRLLNKGIVCKLVNQKVIEFFSDHNINAQEIYNWLLNNQINANSIFLLGYFHYYGIITSLNNEKALNLFIKSSEKDHILAQFFVGCCYKYGYGAIKNDKLAFEYYEKVASKGYSAAQLEIGCSYRNGIGIEKDFKKAICWYEKAATNGNIIAMCNLGSCYINGIVIEKDYNKAFEFYKQSAEGGHTSGITMLGYCYSNGIGTKIDKQKAFELYQNAANLEDKVAQNNLALIVVNNRVIIVVSFILKYAWSLVYFLLD